MADLQSINSERSIVIQKTAFPTLLACLLVQMVLSQPYHTFAQGRSDQVSAQNPSASAFTQDQSAHTFEEHHMGTLFKITLYAESDSVAELAATNAFLEIDRLNTIMSDYLDESELNRFSRTSGTGSFIRLSDPLFEILRQAQWISYQTNGMFDVTGGFAKPGILVEFNARAKIKPQHSCPIRGFYFCDKAEGGQNNSFAKPPKGLI